MKSESAVVLCMLFWLIGFIVGQVSTRDVPDVESSSYVMPLITLVSVFLGAWFAYKLQNKQQKNEIETKQAALGNQALLNLYKQNMTLAEYSKFISEFRGNEKAYILLGPKMDSDEPNMSVDSSSLLFLSDKNDFELLTEIISADQIFRHTTEYLSARSILFESTFMPAFMNSSHENILALSDDDIIDLIGAIEWGKLKLLTTLLYGAVDEALLDNYRISRKLLDVLHKRFPEHDYGQYTRLFEHARGVREVVTEDDNLRSDTT